MMIIFLSFCLLKLFIFFFSLSSWIFLGISHQDQVDTSDIAPFVQVCLQSFYFLLNYDQLFLTCILLPQGREWSYVQTTVKQNINLKASIFIYLYIYHINMGVGICTCTYSFWRTLSWLKKIKKKKTIISWCK